MQSRDTIETRLLELERHLAQGDLDALGEPLDRLLAEDFREFGGSGTEYDKDETIAALRSVDGKPQPSEIRDVVFHWLGDAAVQLSYRSVRQGRVCLRSSVWRCREGRWQMCFHQATPAD